MKAKGVLLGIILGVIAIGLFTSCEELDGLLEDIGVTLTTDYYEMEFIIPPAPAGIPVEMMTTMEANLDEVITSNGYNNATVNSVEVEDAIMGVTEKSNVSNLNAIDTLSISVSTDQLSETAIAHCKNTIIDAETLSLETRSVNVNSYIESEQYNLITYGMLKESLTDTLWLTARIRYKVKLTIPRIGD